MTASTTQAAGTTSASGISTNDGGDDDDDDDDDDDNDDGDDLPYLIEPPRDDILEMFPAQNDRNLRNLVRPFCERAFQTLFNSGNVLDLNSPYIFDFLHGDGNDDCGKFPLLYAMFAKKTGKLVKIGYTVNVNERKAIFQRTTGKNPDDYNWIVLVHLDWLDEASESSLQQIYNECMDSLLSSPFTPSPLKKVLHYIRNRGGEELGAKKKFIHLMLEAGAQTYYKVGKQYDFLMCDVVMIQKRYDYVKTAVEQVVTILRPLFDTDQPKDVQIGASWAPGCSQWEKSSPTTRLTNTPTIMEYVTKQVIDMNNADMIPVPAVQNPTTATEMFSKNYKRVVVDQGGERLRNFIRGAKDNSISLIDSNQFIINHIKYGHINKMLTEYNFHRIINIANGEVDIHHHNNTTKKRTFWKFQPFCITFDSRGEIQISLCTKRGLSTEIVKQSLDNLLSNQERDITVEVDDDNDAILAGYMFEYMVKALHMNKRYGAAIGRDVLTPNDVMALQQNGLRKTPTGNYPIAMNLRKKLKREETDRPLEALIIRRATNYLSLETQTRDGFEDADAIIRSDSPSYDTIENRWGSVLSGLKPTSELRIRLERDFESDKVNTGNADAFGRDDDEKIKYDDEFRQILDLGLGTKFLIRKDDTIDPESVPAVTTTVDGQHLDYFTTFAYAGLRERITERTDEKYALRHNTNHYKLERSTKVLAINCPHGPDGRNQYVESTSGTNNAFVVACLYEGVEDPEEKRTQQMEAISNLAIGTKIWLRLDKTSSVMTPEPDDKLGSECYNMPTWASVRDYLDKIPSTDHRRKDKRPKKLKTIVGDWILCEVAVKVRRRR